MGCTTNLSAELPSYLLKPLDYLARVFLAQVLVHLCEAVRPSPSRLYQRLAVAVP